MKGIENNCGNHAGSVFALYGAIVYRKDNSFVIPVSSSDSSWVLQPSSVCSASDMRERLAAIRSRSWCRLVCDLWMSCVVHKSMWIILLSHVTFMLFLGYVQKLIHSMSRPIRFADSSNILNIFNIFGLLNAPVVFVY